ncbi:hypothetical protein HK101_003659 [Irineochytrium annulatum]|nr:hypothetical protein HK101_003659 [Irineochytrium annulatum]
MGRKTKDVTKSPGPRSSERASAPNKKSKPESSVKAAGGKGGGKVEKSSRKSKIPTKAKDEKLLEELDSMAGSIFELAKKGKTQHSKRATPAKKVGEDDIMEQLDFSSL